MDDSLDLVALSAHIIGAYVSNNSVAASDLPFLIQSVHDALSRIGSGRTEEPQAELKPAVSIKKSVTPDYLISLEDGKRYKSLKRHLSSKYDMTPDQYRAKWGLPSDYPMVAPNYAAARSDLAKKMGLGRKPGEAAPKKADGKLGRKARR